MKFRNVNDKVRIRFLGEVYDGIITDLTSRGTDIFYQVFLENGKQTQLWFRHNEVMNPYNYP